jgi:hypothetical protein
MRCASCHRNIAAGVEAQKMIVEYEQSDGSIRIFGYMMSDGPISAATGQMVRGRHHKCFWIAKKREAKGDAVTGRVVAGGPTGYDIAQLVLDRDDLAALGITPEQARERSTALLTARVNRLRAVAEGIGKGVGDPQVQEAFAADEHGGPYDHQHHHRLETYQLIAHLEYAHGLKDLKLLRTQSGIQDQHAEMHAQQSLSNIQKDRLADDEPEPRTRDWREQHTAVIE